MNETQKCLRCQYVLPNEIFNRSDEKDSGWEDEIRATLGVTFPICQPDDDGRGERNGHPFDILKIDEEVSA